MERISMRTKRRKNTIAASVTTGKHSVESDDYEMAVEAFLRHCKIRNLTNHTLQYYVDVLGMLKRLLPADVKPRDITKVDIEDALLTKRSEGVVDATVDKYYRGWRAFFNFLRTEGHIATNPMDTLQRAKSEKRVIETFSKSQLRALFAAPNKSTFTGYRDYVIMLTLLETFCRVSELEGIKVTDIRWKDSLIKVYGKGRKERYAPFQSKLRRHLEEYVKIRGVLDHDFLFVNIDNTPIKVRTIQDSIAGYGRDAGIRGVRVSPHTFRHTGAKMYIINGGDVFSLQKILGHESLEMVRNYVNLFGVDVAEKHRKYSPLERLDEDDE